MSSLANLNDKQNHLLTQLSYQSHILQDKYNGQSLDAIYRHMIATYGKDNGDVKAFKKYIDAGLGDIVVKDVANNKTSGFGAIAFEDSKGNVGITYRGTDGLSADSINDWGDNLSSAVLGTSYQTAEAEAFFDKNYDEKGNNYLYGHSKGGNLSQSVFANNYTKIKKVHNLNPQPINPYSLTPDQLNALNSDKMDVVVTEGDYVWFLGEIPYLSRIRVMDKTDGDSHLYNGNRYDENGNIIPGSQPFWEYLAVGGLTLLSPIIQGFTGGIGFIYNTTVRVIDFVKNDLIPFAQSVVDSLVDFVKKINNKLRDFADTVSSFFNDLINGVKDWWKKSFNYGCKYSNSNPYIVINTTKMNSYANQLANLSQRAKVLDRRMNSLYWKLGIEWDTIANLGRLLKAEVVLDFAYRLDKNAAYLRTTANEFDSVEREISNMLG